MIDPIIVFLAVTTNDASSPRAAHEIIMWYCPIARAVAAMPKIVISASFNRRPEGEPGKESKL
jgi:hypothetical protein